MKTAKVGDVATQIRGVTYNKADVIDVPRDGFLPVLRANNITDRGLTFDDLVFVRAGNIAPKQRIVRGDIVIAASSGSLSVVGKAAQATTDFDGSFGAFCKVVRPGPLVDASYLGHFFRTSAYRRLISSLAAGANINNLKSEHLDDLMIPLPPLPEQRRIAAILDQADALRRLRRDSLDRLGDLGQAIFEDRYGSLAGEVCIEDAVSDTLIGMVRNGGSFGPDFAIPYVRMDAITTDGAFLPEKVQRTDASDAEIARYALETGDILFNTRNSKELVGKTTIYRGAGPCTFNNNIMRIRMKPDWDPVFVEAFLRSKTGRQELEKRKSGTTSVWAVYWSQLKTLKIPKPSREVQASFRALVEAIWKKADLLREDRQKMEHLFASLQHRAFRGEL